MGRGQRDMLVPQHRPRGYAALAYRHTNLLDRTFCRRRGHGLCRHCWLPAFLHVRNTVLTRGRGQPGSDDHSSEASHRPGLTILMFRNIILRVALYPIVSCVLNLSTAAIDLYESRNYARKHPGSVELRWRLNLTDLAILAGRPLIYGLLAVIDPSFIRALRALRHPENESTMQSHDPGRSALCLSTVIDIPPEVTYCETPQLGTTIEEAKERRLDEEQDQSGMTVNTPAPTQRPSIDVACHI
ncbi:hypothetical protein B0H14DRAFT_3881457 [Mycena olivaceomarginata]|nr:hypothetical protein B0H14DRAFT_3881457 [Mycena olivaceomarginata]